MKHSKRLREQRDVCARLHDDDGLDARRKDRSRRADRTSYTIADRRLCKVALHAISHTLLELAHDPFLSLLHAHSVTIERGRMLVVLAPVNAVPSHIQDTARTAAAAAQGPMRAAIARAINRKRTPELVVEFSPTPLQSEEIHHE